MMYALLLLLLVGCAPIGEWEEYDAGLAKLWIGTNAMVDQKCRERGADPQHQRTDLLRGCADLCAGEIFSILDAGVIGHEVWHMAYQTAQETNTACRINVQGEGPR